MDGSARRRQAPLSLQRDFAGSRLEQQILARAFELIVPSNHLVVPEQQPPDAAGKPASTTPPQTQGARGS